MVGGVSHEMNNPLMGISNYVQFVQKHLTPEQSKEFEMLSRAQNEVERMQRLVQNMLKFLHQNSEIESANVDIESLVATVLDVTEPKCKKADIQVQVDIDPEAKNIVSNADLLQQIILNLVTNAIDAMENEKERLLRISVKKEHEDMVKLSVTDTGSGISEKVRRKMFDPFFTTKEPGKGTGLGLSIVIRSIEALGAQIQVSDNVPHGAKFDIKFKVDSRTDENKFA
jgi:signal transduction histidine kinase